jgi:pyruvate ferredoxin oxidoreductase alpha subunit
VIDQNLSMGAGGILHAELAAALYGHPAMPLLVSFIAGLGGRDISAEDFYEMASVAATAARTGVVPEPRLIYTGAELREVRKLQAIAVAERREIGRSA